MASPLARQDTVNRLVAATQDQNVSRVLVALQELEDAKELFAINDADSFTGLSALLTAVAITSPHSELILQPLLLSGGSVYAGKGRDAREAALRAHNASAVELLDKWEAQGATAWDDSDAKKLLGMSAADSARWIESYRATMTAKSNAELDSTETIDHFAPPSPQHTFAVSPYTSR